RSDRDGARRREGSEVKRPKRGVEARSARFVATARPVRLTWRAELSDDDPRLDRLAEQVYGDKARRRQREQALENFKTRPEQDQVLLQGYEALRRVGKKLTDLGVSKRQAARALAERFDYLELSAERIRKII